MLQQVDEDAWPFTGQFIRIYNAEQQAWQSNRPTLAFCYAAALDRIEGGNQCSLSNKHSNASD